MTAISSNSTNLKVLKEPQIYEESQNKLKSNCPYPPLSDFTTIKCASSLSFKSPTIIQKYAIPALLHNHSVLCRAPTGMGKTLCYLLPLIENINSKSQGIQLCVISPTRELCAQIADQATKLAQTKGLSVECFYGSKKVIHYIPSIDIIICAPGKLIEYLGKKLINFDALKYLVLDEADKLLDMGFEENIREIKSYINPQTITSLFSATFPKKLGNMIKEFLPEDRCNIEIENESLLNIEQILMKVDDKDKALKDILSKYNLVSSWKNKTQSDRILIFAEKKIVVDELQNKITFLGHRCVAIHGDKLQAKREENLNKFRIGDIPILIATSVAARGIDVKDIDLVINYDFPKDIKEYLHKIGRTGREGKKGKAISLIMGNELSFDMKADIISVLNESKNLVPDFLKQSERQRTHRTHRDSNDKRGHKQAPGIETKFAQMKIESHENFIEKEDSEDDMVGGW